MTRADRLLAVFLACLALAASPVVGAHGAEETGSSVVVMRSPTGAERVPLDRDQTYRVHGLRGRVLVVVEGSSVRVVESSCRDRVCVHAGAIDSVGEAVACIPNGVVVTIEEGSDDDLDAVVR